MSTMDRLAITLSLLSLLFVVLTPVNGQVCYTHSESSTTAASPPDRVITVFPPSAAGEERVQQLSVRADTIPIRIQLLQSYTDDVVTDAVDYYEIVLGTDGTTGSWPFTTTAGKKALIARVSGNTPIDPTATSPASSNNVISLSAASYQDFVITMTKNGNSASIAAGFANDSDSFVSLNDPNPIDDICFLGVTGDGDYRACESTSTLNYAPYTMFGNLIPNFSDGDTSTMGCTASTDYSTLDTARSIGIVLYLEEESEVYGVSMLKDTGETSFVGANVRVGNCGYSAPGTFILPSHITEIDKNENCGTIISGETNKELLYRKCPDNTYGNVVSILIDSGTDFSPICEVTVFGRERPVKTTVSFQSATYSVTEDDVAAGTPKTITLTRQPANNPICTLAHVIQVDPTSSNLVVDANDDKACTDADDIYSAELTSTYPVLPVTFDKGENTKDIDITICGDYVSENTEFITLGFDQTENVWPSAGDTDTSKLTISDNDPDYYFDVSTFNPGETDGSVELTIIKSGYTGEETKISIVTNNGDDGTAALNAMFESNDYVQLMEGSDDSLVTFPIGETSMTAVVDISDDVEGEMNEMFTVQIYVTRDNQITWELYDTVTLGKMSVATITITDNDPGFQIISPQTFNNAETDGYIEVTIQDTKADSGSTGGTVTLTAAESDTVSAIQGSDFESFTTTLTFTAGEKYKTVRVPITDDKLVEEAETFKLTLTSTSGEVSQIVSGMDEATLTIDDDDATVSMAVSAQDVTERDGSVKVVIKRDVSEFIDRVAWVDVEILGASATALEDFLVPDNLRLYFNANNAETSITIPVVNDKDIEANQTFVVRITDADNPIDTDADTTTINIQSDDALIRLVQTPNQVVEGETFVATVMREGGDGFEHEVYVNTNSDGENAATAGTDFEVISMAITFAADEDSKSVMIDTIEDDTVEETETFRVTITDPNDVVSETESELDVSILDDDSLVGFEKTSYEVTETTGSDTVVRVTLTRGGDTSNRLSVVLSTEEINGASSDDFSAITSMTLTFSENQPAISQEVTIKADNNPEFAETFRVIVRSDADGGLENIDPARSSTIITILDDDSGSFRFDRTEYSVDEGQGVLSATILRPGATAGYVDLLVTASPITATYPDDYLQEEVQVQFSPEQDSAPVQIAIVGDNDFREGDETFKISLSIESDFGTLDPEYDEATVTIHDSQSSFSLSTTTPTVVESEQDYVTITIHRSGSTNTDALVSLKTMDGTATHSGDFKGFNLKTFAFPSGTQEMSVEIGIDDNDFIEEREETFSVVIVSADGEIMEDSSLTITIIDDDAHFSFTPTSTTDDDPLDDLVYYTTAEDGGVVTVTVQRIGNSDSHASVRATTVDDTAKAKYDDYLPFDDRVINFSPAQTTAEFTVAINDDEETEGDESFFVELSNPRNGVVVWPHRAKITIESNDRSLGTPNDLSSNAIIGIAVGVGGLLVMVIIAGIAFFVLLKPSQPTLKQPPFPGPRPVPRAGIGPTAGVRPNPYQPRPQLYRGGYI